MITKTLTLTTGKIKVNIPTDLNEITVGQLAAMQNVDEDLNTIPLIPELTKEVIENITDYQELLNVQQHILSLGHKIKYCYDGSALPDYIVFGTKKTKRFGIIPANVPNKIKVIKNLSVEPAGAFLASRDIIATEINRHIEEFGEDKWKDNFNPDIKNMTMVLAHYFYCRVTGNVWQEQAAEDFVSEIYKLPLQTALPVARYFFFNYPNLLQQKIPLWQALRQSWKNAQALRRLRNSDTSTR